MIRPLTDVSVPERDEKNEPKKLYVRLSSESDAAYERIKLLLEMFPGNEQMVIYFADTKKRRGASCIVHEALVKELTEMLGGENVVLKKDVEHSI